VLVGAVKGDDGGRTEGESKYFEDGIWAHCGTHVYCFGDRPNSSRYLGVEGRMRGVLIGMGTAPSRPPTAIVKHEVSHRDHARRDWPDVGQNWSAPTCSI
jgi:hypothetical protein